jgi:hypothetical protein
LQFNLVRERDAHPSSANATMAGKNGLVEVAWGPLCGIVTHTGFELPQVETLLDWMRSVSGGARAVMGMMDGIRSSRASLTGNE